MDKVIIFDTTLRGGGSRPARPCDEELNGRQLARLGVDDEAIPGSSPGRRLSSVSPARLKAGHLRIGALRRTRYSRRLGSHPRCRSQTYPRVHRHFDIHLQHKLRMTRECWLPPARWSLWRSLCDDIEFSPECGRSDPEFMYAVLAEAISAGATTLNIPDSGVCDAR